MTTSPPLRVPVFIVNVKSYVWGRKALRLARIAEKAAQETSVNVIVIPQLVDIHAVANGVSLQVFAPHMDYLRPGRGTGRILPEAIKEAGAVGTMLNHVENRLALSDITRAIGRARHVGLYSMVCCSSPEESRAIATLGPDAIISEPPSRIGTLRSVGKDNQYVTQSIRMVKEVDPRIAVICGAGVSSGDDVAELIRLGVDGTGATRAICEAKNPLDLLNEMVEAVEREWQLRKL